MSLPYDVARCNGVRIDGEWREGCEDCLRRTAPRPSTFYADMQPPAIVVFECEARIEGEAK